MKSEQERLLEASHLVGQATSHLDNIVAARDKRIDDEYAFRTRQSPFYKRKYTMKDARIDADRACRLLREAWELLDPTTPPFKSNLQAKLADVPDAAEAAE